MKQLGVWEPFEVKTQTIKTAIESATLLLRIDDIVSGIQKKNKTAPGQAPGPQVENPDQVLTHHPRTTECCVSSVLLGGRFASKARFWSTWRR